ncbi:MAG: ABC transporter permease [Paracoccaceae bacterium]
MTVTLIRALAAYWRRQPVQALTLVLGLALATALFSGVQAINMEAKSAYAEAARAVSGPGAVLERADGAPVAQETYVALRRAGWQVSPVLDGTLRIGESRVRLLGIDPLTAPVSSAAGQAALGDESGDFFARPGLLLGAPATLARLDPAATDLSLRAVEGLAPGILFADIGIAQTLLGREGELTRLILREAQPRQRAPLSQVAPQLTELSSARGGDLARLTDSFHLNLTAFGLLSFAVGLFIVHSTIGLAFEQRRPMFRTLRALGAPARLLIGLLVAELAAFALIAGLLGTALGYVIAAALLPDVAATLTGLYGANIEGSLSFRPGWWLGGLAVAALGTALAATGSLLKMARMPVLAPARPRAWAIASDRVITAQGMLAAALIVLSVLCGLFGTGLLMGFVTLAALLLGAAFALPLFLRAAIGLAERAAGGVLAQWFWADTRQQVPGLSLALMALLLALATNIGVGTMVSSFRLTFTGWLDQRLASELYLSATDTAQAAEMRGWLEGRVDAILPIASTEVDIAGAPGEIYGVADHPTYRDNWPLLARAPQAWDKVADGTGILINEQLSYRADLGPGDRLALPGGWRPEIVGIYSDYGNPRAQVMIGTQALTARFPQVELTRFALRVPEAESAALAKALSERFALAPEALIDQQAIKTFSLGVFERTFTVSAALNVLTLSVAGFAILTSLLTLSVLRVPQLAPVWALGLPHGTLARLELLRAVLLASLTLICALPLGLALAWVLLNIVNVEAFGWRLPMYLFPRDWGVLSLLALAAAALASLWPALRLARTPPAALLKVFANER